MQRVPVHPRTTERLRCRATLTAKRIWGNIVDLTILYVLLAAFIIGVLGIVALEVRKLF